MKNTVRYMGGVLCESSAVDQATQNLSAFKFLDQLTVDLESKDPLKTTDSLEKVTIPFNFQMITLWKRQNHTDAGTDVDAKIQVDFLDPDKKSLQKTTLNFAIPMTKVRARNVLNINGLAVTKTGEYCLELRELGSDGETSDVLACLCFDVIVNRK